MAFCRNCGSNIGDEDICPNCGAVQTPQQTTIQTAEKYTPQPTQPPVVDNGGIGWGLLGCCIPIVGLVLFLVWKDTKPKTAKAAGIGALVAVILGVLWYIIVGLVGVGVAMM